MRHLYRLPYQRLCHDKWETYLLSYSSTSYIRILLVSIFRRCVQSTVRKHDSALLFTGRQDGTRGHLTQSTNSSEESWWSKSSCDLYAKIQNFLLFIEFSRSNFQWAELSLSLHTWLLIFCGRFIFTLPKTLGKKCCNSNVGEVHFFYFTINASSDIMINAPAKMLRSDPFVWQAYHNGWWWNQFFEPR